LKTQKGRSKGGSKNRKHIDIDGVCSHPASFLLGVKSGGHGVPKTKKKKAPATRQNRKNKGKSPSHLTNYLKAFWRVQIFWRSVFKERTNRHLLKDKNVPKIPQALTPAETNFQYLLLKDLTGGSGTSGAGFRNKSAKKPVRHRKKQCAHRGGKGSTARRCLENSEGGQTGTVKRRPIFAAKARSWREEERGEKYPQARYSAKSRDTEHEGGK